MVAVCDRDACQAKGREGGVDGQALQRALPHPRAVQVEGLQAGKFSQGRHVTHLTDEGGRGQSRPNLKWAPDIVVGCVVVFVCLYERKSELP